MRYLLLLLALCGPLHAGLDDFPNPARRTLFAVDDPYSARPLGPDGERRDDGGLYLQPAEPGWFGIALWGTPYTRFTDQPFGIAAGTGVELSFDFTPAFALAVGAGIWTNLVDARENGDYVEEDAGGFEAELGFRWRFFRWESGALYTDARAVIAWFDGPGPVRGTSSIGGGSHFGVEIGSTTIRFYLEAGLEVRIALNYRNVGWLYNGERNEGAGLFIDLARFGLRVYL